MQKIDQQCAGVACLDHTKLTSRQHHPRAGLFAHDSVSFAVKLRELIVYSTPDQSVLRFRFHRSSGFGYSY